MSLENLTGPNTGFNDLVTTNPDGTDPVSEGDNHIRGVKNVTVNVLGPMVSAAVSLPAVGALLAWDGTKYIPSSGSVRTLREFVASQTYTPTAGTKRIRVTLVGGGGGGAGVPATGASQGAQGTAGAGAGACIREFTAAQIGVSQVVTVGLGGLGGVGTTGGKGGDSTFGAFMTAFGGEGGNSAGPSANSVATGSNGGSATGGEFNIFGVGSAMSRGDQTITGQTEVGTGGFNPLFGGGFLGDCIVECKRPVDNASADLSAIVHF